MSNFTCNVGDIVIADGEYFKYRAEGFKFMLGEEFEVFRVTDSGAHIFVKAIDPGIQQMIAMKGYTETNFGSWDTTTEFFSKKA